MLLDFSLSLSFCLESFSSDARFGSKCIYTFALEEHEFMGFKPIVLNDKLGPFLKENKNCTRIILFSFSINKAGADPVFYLGGAQLRMPKGCWHREAELREESELLIARVQHLLKDP